MLAAIALTSVASLAQTTSTETKTPVSFGIKAGINIAQQSGVTSFSIDSKSSLIGLNAGAFATLHLSDHFGIQPELAWSTLGIKAKTIGSTGSPSHDAKQLLNYLTVPVLAKYAFTGSGFSLYAGPQIGFLLSAKYKQQGATLSNKENFKNTELAGVAGAEFEFPHTPFNISGRYQMAITKAEKSGASARNNAATFTVGYRFK